MEANTEQAVSSLKDEATGLAQWANGLTVATQEDANTAMQRLSIIKGMRTKVVAWFAPMKTAAAAAHKAIVAREKEITDVADNAEGIVKNKVMAWQQEQRRLAEVEQRRLQAIADEAARKERARLEAEAAKLKTPEKKAERLEAAAAVVAPTVTIAAPVATASGTSVRKTYRAVLVSKDALIVAAAGGSGNGNGNGPTAATMLIFDQKAADAFARATHCAVQVPGVRFEEVESLSVRSM